MPESTPETNNFPHNQEIDLDVVQIKFLSDSPEGFNVKTRTSLNRHAPNTPLPEAVRIGKERAKEKKVFRVGEKFKPKVGIRNITQNGSELSIDVMPVTYPTYSAIRNPEETPESLSISNPTGVSTILLTTEIDGSHKMVFQHRSEKNKLYGDIPGSSIAGFMDGVLDRTREGRGKILPIDTDTVKDNILREAEEEIGVKREEMTRLAIIGIGSDRVAVHNEFLLLGTTSLNAEELAKRSGEGDDFDFTEKFYIVDATPENIEILLTKVKCPLPPTHVGTFFAAGYTLVLESGGFEKAEEWKKRVSREIRKNYGDINNIVRTFYADHSEEVDKIPEGKSPRNLTGYDPAYRPSEQGLPDAIEEFKRTGLLKEVEKTHSEAYIFDVDGVISDPGEKRPTIDGVLEAIANKLDANEPVALNTGRSTGWMIDRIIAPLILKVKDKKSLSNFFAVGEKGGTWLTFNEEGLMSEHEDDSISVPKELQDRVREIIDNEFSDTIFFDGSKKTIISVEMRDDIKERRGELFTPEQERLTPKLEELLKTFGLSETFKVDPTTIATDVENKHVGKDFAVRRILSWLKDRGVTPSKFIAFGDSVSDIPMAEEIHNQGLPVEMVFVGSKTHIDPSRYGFPITVTNKQFEEGTLEYLNQK